MKKKIKKISKEDVLKKELAETRYQNSKKEEENARLRGILNQTLDILDPKHIKYYDGLKFEDIPAEVMKLKEFKQFHEGAVHPLSDVITNQREIIRWLINPDTAETSKELESLRNQFGLR
jgi:hypothetical protein